MQRQNRAPEASPYVRPEKTLKMGPKSPIKFPFKEGSHGGEMLQSLSLIAQNAFLLFIGQNLLVLKAQTTSPICWTPPRHTKKLDPSFSRPQIRYSSAVHIGELPGSCAKIAKIGQKKRQKVPYFASNPLQCQMYMLWVYGISI